MSLYILGRASRPSFFRKVQLRARQSTAAALDTSTPSHQLVTLREIDRLVTSIARMSQLLLYSDLY
jgi:hypothetical protein